ncbi:hypothetical protein [Burkholderia alba]|uniref:hypothetical protein n=1 Tax=Burkholderia alba TaxID=2683677 RepID=UPI002B052B5B|nr:hypothetical protein [Burkholderia alba]
MDGERTRSFAVKKQPSLPELGNLSGGWGDNTIKALNAVAQSITQLDGGHTAGLTGKKQPSLRSTSLFDSSKLKMRPGSTTDAMHEVDATFTDTTSTVDPPEPSQVFTVVETTLYKTEAVPIAKTVEATEASNKKMPSGHVERLAYVFDSFFSEVATRKRPSNASSVKQSVVETSNALVVADVAPAEVAEQLDATREPNERFSELLKQGDMEVIPNSGNGNNCAIYSLVQCAAPDLRGPDLDEAVGKIRTDFDANHSKERDRMLLLDTNAGGHGAELVSLVNEHFSVDMQIGVVQAGVDEAHPVTALCQFHGSQHQSGQSPTHRVVVWDKHGHFEAVIGKPVNAIETPIDDTKRKTASLPEDKGVKAPLWDTPLSTSTKPVTKKAAESPRWSKKGDKHADKTPDGTALEIKKTTTENAVSRTHGEALEQLVPDVSKSAKAFRKLGRWMFADNEYAVPQLLNNTKPEIPIMQGLAKTGKDSKVPSYLLAGHEFIDMAYAGHELTSAAMRKSRYQTKLGQWPASADEPKITTGGREVPLSEVARMTDFQSRYDLKVAILGQSEDSPAREKMLDVLTGRYIAEVQGKNRVVRAVIRTTMSAVGVGANVGLAVGTHGAANAALVGGAILSGRDLINNREVAHSVKQHYRDKKMAAIVDGAMRERVEKQLAGEPSKDEKANWGSRRDEVNQQYIWPNVRRFVPIKFDRFNENKSTDNKKQEVDLVKKHAAMRVVSVLEESNSRHSLRDVYLENSGVRKKELKQFYREVVRVDTRDAGRSDIALAVQLMRDLNMSKMEAISHLRGAVVSTLVHQRLSMVDRKSMMNASDKIERRMAETSASRLESVIGSAMARR